MVLYGGGCKGCQGGMVVPLRGKHSTCRLEVYCVADGDLGVSVRRWNDRGLNDSLGREASRAQLI